MAWDSSMSSLYSWRYVSHTSVRGSTYLTLLSPPVSSLDMLSLWQPEGSPVLPTPLSEPFHLTQTLPLHCCTISCSCCWFNLSICIPTESMAFTASLGPTLCKTMKFISLRRLLPHFLPSLSHHFFISNSSTFISILAVLVCVHLQKKYI